MKNPTIQEILNHFQMKGVLTMDNKQFRQSMGQKFRFKKNDSNRILKQLLNTQKVIQNKKSRRITFYRL